MNRREWMKLAALFTGAGSLPLLQACGQRHAMQPDAPLRIGYLPITDATPLLVAHSRKLFEAEGVVVDKPVLFRSWAQLVEAFISGQVNLVHVLSPMTVWARYGSQSPLKVLMWNHMAGSALTVQPGIGSVADLGGKTVAIPFWYSIHNILLQKILTANKLTVVTRARGAALKSNEVNLIVLAPSEMVSALATKSIAGFIVAEPFNAAAENARIGKVLRFSGDVWKNHACCVTFLAERDLNDKPEWSQRVTNAIVNAQLWSRSNQIETAKLLSSAGPNRYTPHQLQALTKVLATTDYTDYEKRGIVAHPAWKQRRIDFQPFPFASYTEELVRAIGQTKVEGDTAFLAKLDPKFVARDLIDDRFVRKSIGLAGGPGVFGLPANLLRTETIAV